MEDLVKVIVLENEVEAQFVATVLEERGIPHFMQSYRDTAYDGLFQTQKGWGHVTAPASFREAIVDIVMEARSRPADAET